MKRSSLSARRRLAPVAVAPLALVAVLLPGVPAQAAAAPAQVTVVHGVRGLVADVRVDGKLVLKGFAPERITNPLPLPAGSHRIQVWRTGAAASSKPILDITAPVTSGSHVTLGVGLTAAGKPQITAFDDSLAEAAGGATAVAVRDLAHAPPVKVTVDSGVFASAIQAPQQKVAKIAPGSHSVSVLPTTGSAPLVPPQSVPVVAGRVMVLYLIGSAADHSLGWITQTVQPSAAAAAPRSVQTGVGPLETSGRGLGRWTGTALGVLALSAGIVVLARRRRSPADGV